MAKPMVHAESSARRFGGVPSDYLKVHQLLDSSKSTHADCRHRALTKTVLIFPTIGTGPKTWELTRDHLSAWQELYPGVDVDGQCRRALAWILANPERRKTAKDMERFIVNWLNRSVTFGAEKLTLPPPATVRQPWICRHEVPCSHREMCRIATELGRPEKVAS